MTEEAQRQARAERGWWRQQRDAKQLFGEELRLARSILSTNALLHEIYGYFDGLVVRRLLLPKTRSSVLHRARARATRPDRRRLGWNEECRTWLDRADLARARLQPASRKRQAGVVEQQSLERGIETVATIVPLHQ